MLNLKKSLGILAASTLLAGPAMAEELTIGLASEPTAMDPHFHNLGPNNARALHIFAGRTPQAENRGRPENLNIFFSISSLDFSTLLNIYVLLY